MYPSFFFAKNILCRSVPTEPRAHSRKTGVCGTHSAIVFSVGVKRGRGEVAAAAAHLGKRKKMVARGMAGAPRDWDVGERGFGGQGTRGMAPDFRREAERFLSLNVKARRRERFFHDLRDM